MGLHRLYCIPEGFPPTDGVYVRYRPQEWYAFLSVEAHRVGATLVGEDLGTVPAYVRTAMRRHRVLGSYVAQYQARPEAGAALPDPPPSSVASVNTHDMPPFASFWEGEDVGLRVDLGLLDPESARAKAEERLVLRGAMAAFLVDRGFLESEKREDPRAVLDGCLAYLAASDAAIVVAKLDDLWLDHRPQNVPGTTVEHPNWRIRMRHTLEELRELDDVGRTLDRIAALRERSAR
jgi:4-alpha-glucanotransferase